MGRRRRKRGGKKGGGVGRGKNGRGDGGIQDRERVLLPNRVTIETSQGIANLNKLK